ncbi:MAG: hypothetical protein IJ706_08360 [Clostridia bacterium]|nr:hypothetical protein [Clostridia bacterium]
MKVFREVRLKVNRIEVGDRIKVKFGKERHTATAIREDKDGVLFLLDDCLDKAYPMNRDGGTEGGYLESDLRETLNEYRDMLPDKIKERLVPDENGDELRLLSLEEVFGLDSEYNETAKDKQIPWMRDRRKRIATRKGDEYEWWWLNNVVSAAYFAGVADDGYASYDGASYAFGVRPAFKIKNL